MSWAWVVVGLVLWMVASLLVIALCRSARQIDAQLDRNRAASRGAMEMERRAGGGADLE